MAIRGPRVRTTQSQNPRMGDPSNSRSHGDPSDIAGDAFNKLAREQLIPQIANRTRNAIAVDRREVFFYSRLRSGARCACYDAGESAPHGLCQVCWGTGFAGGYHKYGTETYLFDPSRQWWGVNVQLNPLVGLPPWFTLEPDATFGYLEWDESLHRSQYYGIDSSRFEYRNGDGRIKFEIRLDGYDSGFIPYTEDALRQRAMTNNGNRLRFRVTLQRTTVQDRSPMFLQHWYRLLVNSAEPPLLYVDIPRRNESNILAEYGALETFQPIQFVFSDEIQQINLEDIIVRLFDNTRWKVIETSPNDPQNILTSHDIQARKVFNHEILWKVPQ